MHLGPILRSLIKSKSRSILAIAGQTRGEAHQGDRILDKILGPLQDLLAHIAQQGIGCFQGKLGVCPVIVPNEAAREHEEDRDEDRDDIKIQGRLE